MNELLKIYLQKIAEDEKTFEALREVLLTSLDSQKPDLSLNNEDLGAEVRAKEKAKELVGAGLKEIKKLKIGQRSEEKRNPAI